MADLVEFFNKKIGGKIMTPGFEHLEARGQGSAGGMTREGRGP
jgi:hypothetical protein